MVYVSTHVYTSMWKKSTGAYVRTGPTIGSTPAVSEPTTLLQHAGDDQVLYHPFIIY